MCACNTPTASREGKRPTCSAMWRLHACKHGGTVSLDIVMLQEWGVECCDAPMHAVAGSHAPCHVDPAHDCMATPCQRSGTH